MNIREELCIMRMPGSTADASLYWTSEPYSMAANLEAMQEATQCTHNELLARSDLSDCLVKPALRHVNTYA